MSVRDGFGCDLGANQSIGPGAIVNDDLLPETFRELGCKNARDQVDASARRKSDDDAQRACRISLRLYRNRRTWECATGSAAQNHRIECWVLLDTQIGLFGRTGVSFYYAAA